MKNFKTPVRRASLVMFAGLMLLCFSSCIKDNNNYYNPPIGYLTVVQASPDEPSLNFFLNNNLATNRPFQFGDFAGYLNCFTGTRTANFDNAGTMGQLISDTIHINQNQYYSLFLAGTSAHPQYLYLTDTLTQPASGKASVRFINLSPDAGAADLVIQGSGASVTNKGFLGHSGFVAANAGTYTLTVNKAGTNTALATLAGVNLNNGGIYTIWLQGLSAGTTSNDKLGVVKITNAQF